MTRLKVLFLVGGVCILVGIVTFVVKNRAGAPTATDIPLATLETAQPILMTSVDHMPLDTFDLQMITFVPYDTSRYFYSADNTLRAAFSVPFTGQVTVIEQETGKTIVTLELGFTIFDVAFSADNTLMAFSGMAAYTAVDGSQPPLVVIYSLLTGDQWGIGERSPYLRTHLPQFSHSGTLIGFTSTSGDSCSRLSLYGPQFWDLTTNRPFDFALPFPATVFAFSHDDKRIALGDSLGFCLKGIPGLAVIEIESGKVVFQTTLDTTAVTFSPDDRYLLALDGTQHTLHLWDSQSGIALGRYEIDPDLPIRNVYVKFDANRIEIATQDGEEHYFYSGDIPLP
jgi:hypothetical protein